MVFDCRNSSIENRPIFDGYRRTSADRGGPGGGAEVVGYDAAPTKGVGHGGRRVRCGATGPGAGWARWRQGVGGGTQPRAAAGPRSGRWREWRKGHVAYN
jgi:hypothetical protein